MKGANTYSNEVIRARMSFTSQSWESQRCSQMVTRIRPGHVFESSRAILGVPIHSQIQSCSGLAADAGDDDLLVYDNVAPKELSNKFGGFN